MNKIKLLLVGDSMPITSDGSTYAKMLESKYDLDNLSESFQTVDVINSKLVQHNNAVDVTIVHCGIVDCSPRPITRSSRERLNSLKYPIVKKLQTYSLNYLESC